VPREGALHAPSNPLLNVYNFSFHSVLAYLIYSVSYLFNPLIFFLNMAVNKKISDMVLYLTHKNVTCSFDISEQCYESSSFEIENKLADMITISLSSGGNYQLPLTFNDADFATIDIIVKHRENTIVTSAIVIQSSNKNKSYRQLTSIDGIFTVQYRRCESESYAKGFDIRIYRFSQLQRILYDQELENCEYTISNAQALIERGEKKRKEINDLLTIKKQTKRAKLSV
jgi:hypothetical protein